MRGLVDVWQGVCDYCKLLMSDVAFNLWIDVLSIEEMKEQNVYLSVDTTFQKTTILNQYKNLIEDGFSSVLGFDVEVSIWAREDAVATEAKQSRHREKSDTVGCEDYDYTFETFIVGGSNKFAHAASLAVSENPSVIYNPLFIYGNSGLGKTHLLRAIQKKVNEKYPDKVVRYTRAEDFMRELMPAIRKGEIDPGIGAISAFHNKYRTCDVFLVDDVQFFSGKEATQEEFFNTFNTLFHDRKQIVLTSDRAPKDIQVLDDRLRSRFESGLLADISLPEFETRVGILQRKSQNLNIDIKEEVIFYIADQLKSNIRQLEGVVKKMQAYYMLESVNPSIESAKKAIKEIRNDDQPEPVTIQKIVLECARTYRVEPADVRSDKRDAMITKARQVAMYITRDITSMPYASIGAEFGGRDHSTVKHAVTKIDNLVKTSDYEKSIIKDIVKNIRSDA